MQPGCEKEGVTLSEGDIKDAIFIAEKYHFGGWDVSDESIDKAHLVLLKTAKMFLKQ